MKTKSHNVLIKNIFLSFLFIFLVSISGGTKACAAAKLSNKSITLLRNQSQVLYVKNYSGNVKWTSSNKKIANVSKKGVVSGKKIGTATITATCGNKKLKCKVNVNFGDFYSDKTDVKLNSDSKKVTITLDEYDATVTCNIENPNIVSCKWDDEWNGNKTGLTITGKSSGSTRIFITNDVDARKLTIYVSNKNEYEDTENYEDANIPISTRMLSGTYPSTYVIGATIYNSGNHTMRIYSDGSSILDFDYPNFNRKTRLLDDQLKFRSYIDIRQGDYKNVVFMADTQTWTDEKTTLRFNLEYNGDMYMVAASAKLGTYAIYKKI